MVSVILMMAGSGTRMNLKNNKVYLPLADKMIFQHSLDRFLKYVDEVICVVRPEDEVYLKEYTSKIKIAYGGITRQESVQNGLKLVTSEYVLIHDAARPFITENVIKECISQLNSGYCVLVGCNVKDSIYVNTPLHSLNRDSLFSAQTPQGGKTDIVKKCHQKAIEDVFFGTDDISLVLKYSNETVKLINGSDNNFKITTQLDYITAKELIKNV